MADPGQLLGAGQARRPRPDHRDPLAGAPGRRLGLDPARFPAAIDQLALDGLDGHRVVVDVQGAGRFAGRGTHPTGELREVVGGVQNLQRLLPPVAIDQAVPVGDHVVDRTALVAERDAAIHAARGLLGHLRIGQGLDELVPGLQPRLDPFVAAVVAFDLEEAGGLAHGVLRKRKAAAIRRRRWRRRGSRRPCRAGRADSPWASP